MKLKQCPICESEVFLDFLDTMQKATDRYGGPYRTKTTTHTTDIMTNWQAANKGWHSARLSLANLVVKYEDMVAIEAEWETENADVDVSSTYSASKALQMVKEDCKYPATIMDSAECDKRYPRKHLKKDETISFASDTNFSPGRQQLKYCRKSEFFPHGDYQAGSHSARPGHRLVDTGMQTERIFNLSQCKVVTVASQVKFDQFRTNPEQALRKCNGTITREHKLWTSIMQLGDSKMMHADTVESRLKYLSQCNESDIIVVLVDKEDKVVDFALVGTRDNEALSTTETVTEGWTSLRDCMG